MTSEQIKQAVIDRLGSYAAMRAYADANSVTTSERKPENAATVLGVYNSSVSVVSFEDGYFRDADTSERIRFAPHKWAPIPEQLEG